MREELPLNTLRWRTAGSRRRAALIWLCWIILLACLPRAVHAAEVNLVKDINSQAAGSDPQELTAVGERVFLSPVRAWIVGDYGPRTERQGRRRS